MGLLFLLLVIGTTIWATIDASGMQRYKYKGYTGAFVVFLGCFLLWIVCFPIYLIRRGAIVNGSAELKPEYENDPPPSRATKQVAVTSAARINQTSNSVENRYERLQKLGELKEKGLLTEEEFANEKSKLMQS